MTLQGFRGGWLEEQIRALKGELDQLRTALRGDAQNAEDGMSREDTPTLTTPLGKPAP